MAQKRKAPVAGAFERASSLWDKTKLARTVNIEYDNRVTIAESCSARTLNYRQSVLRNGGTCHGGGRPPSFNSFTCPNCGALYQVVKVERGPETNDRDLTCRSCGGSLPAAKEHSF